jgi:hypothetical protein
LEAQKINQTPEHRGITSARPQVLIPVSQVKLGMRGSNATQLHSRLLKPLTETRGEPNLLMNVMGLIALCHQEA